MVAACCDRARASGVTAGMTLAHARALLPVEPVTRNFDPGADQAALHALARWCMRFAPLAAPAFPDAVLLNVSGCERLYGSESRLLDRLAHAMARLGFAARLACASTYAAARAVASCGDSDRAVVPPGGERAVLEPLPLHALRLPEPDILGLCEVGVETIGHLLRLPRSELAARFGRELCARLDRALGARDEAIDPVREEELPAAERVFAGPVCNLETLLLAFKELAADLSSRLLARESGARRIDVLVERIDAVPLRHVLRFSRPTRSAAHLWSLLRQRVEAMHMGFGVERIAMTASSVARLPHDQPRWDGDGDGGGSEAGLSLREEEAAIAELIDALSERLGRNRVVRMHAAESHVPERAFRACPADVSPVRTPAGIAPADRPSILFHPPEPVEVMAITPEGPPFWLRWRNRERRVVNAVGPERIAQEWWIRQSRGCETGDPPRRRAGGDAMPIEPTHFDDAARDYFRVEDETGRWLWIFCARGVGRWFVHGEWS